MDPADLDQQHLVALFTPGGELVAPLVVGGRGDLDAVLREHPTDRLDTPPQPARLCAAGVFADEVDDHCAGRSSSAAKKAAAFRIEFARRNSAFSLFNRFTSADSSDVTPAR